MLNIFLYPSLLVIFYITVDNHNYIFLQIGGKDYTGFDLRKDGVPMFEEAGKYATDLFTDYAVKTIQAQDESKPLFLVLSHLAVHGGNVGKVLEAPQESVNKFKHVADANRRTYAGNCEFIILNFMF